MSILSICLETTIFNYSVETAPAANSQALSERSFRAPRAVKLMDHQGKETPIQRGYLRLDYIYLSAVYMRRAAFVQDNDEVCRL
jgi:hypothetical protein